MARRFISNSYATNLLAVDTSQFTGNAGVSAKQTSRTYPTLVIAVIGGGTVYLSGERNALEDVDGSGVPRGGYPITNVNPPLIIPNFSGTLWARGTQAPSTEIEVQWSW
jgi:hypothetical protein